MVETKKIGIIGYNEGNGHPFSFSAIINGYSQEKMDVSPYPNIAKYLSLRLPSDFGIDNWRVSHIWCPDKSMADTIANCTYIDNRVDDYKAMLGMVNAVIIARDDVKSHMPIAQFFLENGIPVFIDKPLCDDLAELKYFKQYLENGLLMSCTGLRYYPTITNRFSNKLDPNDIVWSHNVSIIDWYKYGIHVLESMIAVMGSDIVWVQNLGEDSNDIVRVQFASGKFSIIQVNKETGFVIQSTFYTRNSEHFRIDYNDNFTCFRNMLLNFANQLNTGKPAINPEETIKIMKTLYAAHLSLKENGRRVYINEFDYV
ncbi:Gfo/Idh/MocA family oxidoreductase [Mucilaginibacter sp. OK098]|uniref:Gfo/Idh/MocA family oxidoreductase n=1 Tax=Mucilaginibacter sp. OK098 TaxID=1855297 RepID=UPI0009150764|nr:Gfo/Idh/MocA family oxidoreductase [Mucilaginibacter sp. OK098]SHL93167.1 hypothetical protein SAMN05216524_101220 [Mucilaginibacter sp. OK098]